LLGAHRIAMLPSEIVQALRTVADEARVILAAYWETEPASIRKALRVLLAPAAESAAT
jgi:hypothetical protein